MSQFIVGLTGGIGSGKSTVARLFSGFGICVVDADEAARQVVAPGQPALTAIFEHFGPTVQASDFSLDRAALRALIFNNDSEKAWLNQLLHPLIRQQMFAQLQTASSPYAILMAPLLLENQLDQQVDQVLVVDVSEAQQIERTMQRDQNDAKLVQAIMASQCNRTERLRRANQIISNQGAASELAEQVDQLHQLYLQLAKEKLAKSTT